MVRLTRRGLVLGAAATPLAAAPFAARAQQAWPSGTIKIIVPFPAGGSVDAIARLVQPELQRRLGATVIIENKAGASGSTGAALAAKSPPDGNTWLLVFDTQAVNQFLMPGLPFDADKDLDPVLLIGTAPNVLCTHPSRSFRSLADVVAAAKAKPDTLTYATIGAGSLGHLTMVLLGKRAGVKLVHVPYRGGGPALNDAIAGHVDLIIGSSALVAGQIAAGKLVPLVQTGTTRAPTLAAVPTAIESGFEKFESHAWWGAYAPAGTPKPIQERFRAELVAALSDEKVAAQLEEAQQIALAMKGPDEFRAFFRAQQTVWGAVIRENGITAGQ